MGWLQAPFFNSNRKATNSATEKNGSPKKKAAKNIHDYKGRSNPKLKTKISEIFYDFWLEKSLCKEKAAKNIDDCKGRPNPKLTATQIVKKLLKK